MNKKTISITAIILLFVCFFVLLSHFIRLNFRHEVHQQVVQYPKDILEEAIEDGKDLDHIKTILSSGNYTVEELNSKVFEIDSRRYTRSYLSLAISRGRNDIVEFLIINGAHPYGSEKYDPPHVANCPLVDAIEKNDAEMVELLLYYGASAILIENDPIYWAIQNNASYEIREMLCNQSPYAKILTEHYEGQFNSTESDRIVKKADVLAPPVSPGSSGSNSGKNDLEIKNENQESIDVQPGK